MKQQREAEKVIYNIQALLTDLKYCSLRRDLHWGKRIHEKTVESQNDTNMYLLTALVRMYAKCGSMLDARRLFDSVVKPDVVAWNVLLLGYTENGQARVSMDMYSNMKERGCAFDSVTCVAALKACISLAINGDGNSKAAFLAKGKEIHSEIGCRLDHYVENTLIEMYAKCGCMLEARLVFDSVQNPTLVSWTALIMGYAENGEGIVALEMFSKMKASGCSPDSVAYIAALKACTTLALNGVIDKRDCLERGKDIHSEIGRDLNQYLENTLIAMYANCGSMVDARIVFDSVRNPNVVCWNVLILGYAENGESLVALDLFSRMKDSGCDPDSVTYIAALKACTSMALNGDTGNCLELGRKIHSEMGCHMDHFLHSALIDMYANCGSIIEARLIFHSIQQPDVVTWNALLLGYAEKGDGLATLELFSRMKSGACIPDSVSYIAAVKACTLTGSLALGRKFHLEVREFSTNLVTCLVDFYAKCGSMVEAREVFDDHPRARIVSTWNALLAGYGSFDSGSVLRLFELMQDEGFRPDAITFVCIFLCCGHAGLIEKAREYFEAMPAKYRLTPTVTHYTCMVDILGRANQLNEAMSLIQKMPCNPNSVTWTALLGACRKWKNVCVGRLAFRALVDIDKKDSAGFVLMAHIYGSMCMWEEQRMVLETRWK